MATRISAYVTVAGPLLEGQGPAILLGYVVVLNAVWGIAAGFWWMLTAGDRKNGRKFGSYMR